MNREVGLGSHSLFPSSPVPNIPNGLSGRKAPLKEKVICFYFPLPSPPASLINRMWSLWTLSPTNQKTLERTYKLVVSVCFAFVCLFCCCF